MICVRMTSAVTAATLLALASYAQAQSIPPEGELHVTYAATIVPPVKPMDIGEGNLGRPYCITACMSCALRYSPE
jgi:hypothetical protein